MNPPFFSIIMPSYNACEFIGEAIEAVEKQSFTDWELIIADDGSTDSTPEILKKLENRTNISVFFLPGNSGGAFTPRSFAAAKARGKYIVTLDADDLIGPDYLAELYDSCQKGDPDLVLTEMWRFSGNPDSALKFLPAESFEWSGTKLGKDLVKFTIEDWQIPIAGFASRTEIYREAIRFTRLQPEGIKNLDEFHSRWLLLLSRKVTFSNARYLYRFNENSVTHYSIFNRYPGYYKVAIAMISMMKSEFGEDSEEYSLAMRNLFGFLISLYRTTNRRGLTGDQKRIAGDYISRSREILGPYDFKDMLSFNFRIVKVSPVWFGKRLLSFFDFLRSFKR